MSSVLHERAFTEISWDSQVAAFLSAALGAEQFKRIQSAIAVPPLATCLRVNTLKATTQAVLQQLQCVLPPGGGVQYAPHPQLPMAILLQGSGPNKVDPQAAGVTKQVVISRKAGEAVLRGAAVFVPGVLAVSSGLSAGEAVAVMVALDAPGSTHSGITRGTILPAHNAASSSSSSQVTAAAAAPPAASTSNVSSSSDSTTAAAAASVPVAAAGDLLCIGLGRAQMGRVEMFRVQHGVAVEMEARVYDVPSPVVDGPLKGCVMLQNLPSIVAAQVLNPKPGSRVLDMCAAPGGKTTMLAQIMQGKGEVIALDRSHAKVDDIKALAAELGCADCVQAFKMDATKAVAKQQQQQQQQQQQCRSSDQQNEAVQPQQPVRSGIAQPPQQQQDNGCQQQQQQIEFNAAGLSAKSLARLQRRIAAMALRGQKPSAAEYRLYGLCPSKQPGFAPESFDVILLDAPCTALGLRPRLLQQHTVGLLLDTAAYQRALLATAVQLLKPGGTLVYSTCTINPAENEMNVRHALDTYSCLELVPAEPRLGGPGLMGAADADATASVVATVLAQQHRITTISSTCITSSGNELAEQKDSIATQQDATTQMHHCISEKHSEATGSHSCEITAVESSSGTSSCASRLNLAEFSRQWLTADEAAMVQRFDPAGPADTIGFFVAKFVKTCSCL